MDRRSLDGNYPPVDGCYVVGGKAPGGRGCAGAVARAIASHFAAVLLLVTASSASADLLLTARDPAALADFYEQQLGLRSLPGPTDAGPTAVAPADSASPHGADRTHLPATRAFALGNERLFIVPGGIPAPRANLRLLLPSDDLAAVETRLIAAGIDVRTVEDEAGVVHALLFADPEGNLLGLVGPGAPPGVPSWIRALSPTAEDLAQPSPGDSDDDRGGHDRTDGVENGDRDDRAAGDDRSGNTRSGRVELAIWSGLHGVGLGFALPYSLGSDSPTAIGLTMMAAGPAAAWAGHTYARRVGLTRGQTRALEYGGDFAMWQAFGWAGVADTEAEETLAWGTVGLVGGAVGTALLTRDRDITPGQAGVFLSAANWGAWFGLVGAQMADVRRDVTGDETLATLLVSSAAGGLAGGVAATAWDPRDSRLAWINLGGVLGTAFGFGLDLVLQVEDDAAVWAIPAATGLGSLVFTTWRTGRQADGRALSDGGDADAQRWHLPGGTQDGASRRVVWLPPAMVPAGRGVRVDLLRARF